MFDYFITVGTLIEFYGKALHLIRFLDVASELNSSFFLSLVSSLCVFNSDFTENVFFALRVEKQLQKDSYSTLMKKLSYSRMVICIFHGPVSSYPKSHFEKDFL